MEENKKMPDGQFKWYLIPTFFKPLGELREVIIAEMDINVTKDITDKNTSLKETIAALEERNGKLVEALETLLEGNEQDPDNPLRWWQRITPQSEALNKAKEALSNNSK